MRWWAGKLSAIVLVLSLASCVSYVDVRAPAPGSVESPIECSSPLEQRGYLRRLRAQDDLSRRLDFVYLDSVRGPQDVILDRFRVENPAKDERGFFTVLADLFRSEPEYAPAYRIYMSIYGAGNCTGPAIPGFGFLDSAAPDAGAKAEAISSDQ